MNYPGEMKSYQYYVESFTVEANGQKSFLLKSVETQGKNRKRLERELEEIDSSVAELQGQIAAIDAKLADPEAQAKKMLSRDFRSVVNTILHGDESQPHARFGLRVEKRGPYIIDKPVSVSRDGKKIVETRQVRVMKLRDNEAALGKFQDYMRQAGNMQIEGLTFDDLKSAIDKFFKDAPRPDIMGQEYEQEQFVEPDRVVSDPGFRF